MPSCVLQLPQTIASEAPEVSIAKSRSGLLCSALCKLPSMGSFSPWAGVVKHECCSYAAAMACRRRRASIFCNASSSCVCVVSFKMQPWLARNPRSFFQLLVPTCATTQEFLRSLRSISASGQLDLRPGPRQSLLATLAKTPLLLPRGYAILPLSCTV